jgi:GT2 family glycosyltransferase
MKIFLVCKGQPQRAGLYEKFTKMHYEAALISVVILNYNGMRFLDRCLASIQDQTYADLEVIIVDNASQDGSAEYVQSRYPWVKVIINQENLGFAEGTNVGIRQARGEYIFTLNNDTWIEERFIEHLAKPIAEKDVGMCASKMLFPDGRINSTGICISRSGAAWDRGMFQQDKGQYNHCEEVFGPCAGAALYRKAMLDEIGLFDEDFFLYMEDVDLAFRGRLAGWKCIYVPEAVVYHHHGGTAGTGSDLSVYYGNRNVIWYVVKDFPTRILLTSLPFILARNLALIPYYALRGQGRVILKSKLDALRGVPGMIRKRRHVLRVTPDNEIARFIRIRARIARH